MFALSYPQFNIWPFAWIALVPLLSAVDGKNLMQSFGIGWLAGFIMFIGQIFWLETFHISVPFVLSAYLAAYFGLFCLLYRFIKIKIAISDLIAIPILWTAIEFLRSIGYWGFPAGLLGYSQHQNLWFIQIANLFGIFGVSFILAFINAAIFSLIKRGLSWRSLNKLAVTAILVFVVFLYGGISLSQPGARTDIKLALIQPNFEYNSVKDLGIEDKIDLLDKLTGKAMNKHPDLIVWPETVVNRSARMDINVSSRIEKVVRKYNVYLLFGNPDVAMSDEKMRHFNSAFLVSPKGEVLAQYNKVHPVPFWEVIPARYYVPFLKNTEAKGACDPGKEYVVFKIPKSMFSSLVCFEGMFSDITRAMANNGAQFVINISNDSWSKSTAEHYQHASMNVFRAIENGIYYARVGNSGVTETIDPCGRIVGSIPIYKEGYLIASIGLRKNATIYSYVGDFFGWGSLILTGVMIGIALFFGEKIKNEN